MRRLAAASLVLAGLAIVAPANAQDGGTRVPCEYEDSVACVWDARHQGNGIGRSFVVRPSGRVIYVSHARAHYLLTGVIL
jgi:hypothetical protein